MYVHWHEGLFLQPHHLQLTQRQLQTEIRAARALLSPYGYGVVESRLSYDDLEDNRIRFERLRVIMPSGQEVCFPEQANLPALDIKAELARGAGGVEVLLAVPLWTRNRANAFRPGEPVDSRTKLLYIPEEVRDVADENTGENPQSLYLRRINARLVLQSEDLSDLETVPLLRVLRATGKGAGKPRLDPEFVPPSVLLRSSPVLHDLMRELVAQLNASREQFRVKVAAGGLGMELKFELTMRLAALNRACGGLPAVVEAGGITPFALQLQLRELLGELLALNPDEKLYDCQPYVHLDPLPCFRELDRKIRGEIRVSRATEPLRVSFTGPPGRLRASLEPRHFDKTITGYYLGIKTRADRTRLALYVTDGNKFKMMPRSMEQVAIFGVELKEEANPPLELPGQSDLRYFRLAPAANPRRWAQLQTDQAVSLVWNNAEFDLTDATFTLYLTLASTSAS